MSDRFDARAPRGILSAAEQAPRDRKPFVPPTVQDLGGLKTLTLVGGSL